MEFVICSRSVIRLVTMPQKKGRRAAGLVGVGGSFFLPSSIECLISTSHLTRVAQTATQIATGIQSGRFYSEHGSNGRRQRILRIPQSAIGEYTARLRRSIDLALAEANLPIDSSNVLIADESFSNHLLYRWKAVVEIAHLDSTAAGVQPFWGGNGDRGRTHPGAVNKGIVR